MYERNVRFVRLKMYERNVHFVRLKMYEKNCTLKCWELSVNNPFGQLEIAIFFGQSEVWFAHWPKIFFSILSTRIECYYTSSKRTALNLQNVQKFNFFFFGQQSFFFPSTRHLVDRMSTIILIVFNDSTFYIKVGLCLVVSSTYNVRLLNGLVYAKKRGSIQNLKKW